MEVFDQVSEKYPASLREAYGGVLSDPAAMARFCVDECGAQVISVRLEGTHPDHGDNLPRLRPTSCSPCSRLSEFRSS